MKKFCTYVVFLFYTASVFAGATASCSVFQEKKLYQRFKSYRDDVNAGSSKLSKYFSNNFNRYYFLKIKNAHSKDRENKRKDYLFGLRSGVQIRAVFFYAGSCTGKNKAVLKLYAKSYYDLTEFKKRNPYSIVYIDFVREKGVWLIDEFHFNNTKSALAEINSHGNLHVIDAFKTIK